MKKTFKVSREKSLDNVERDWRRGLGGAVPGEFRNVAVSIERSPGRLVVVNDGGDVLTFIVNEPKPNKGR